MRRVGFTQMGVRRRSPAALVMSHEIEKGSCYAVAQSVAGKNRHGWVGAKCGFFSGTLLAFCFK